MTDFSKFTLHHDEEGYYFSDEDGNRSGHFNEHTEVAVSLGRFAVFNLKIGGCCLFDTLTGKPNEKVFYDDKAVGWAVGIHRVQTQEGGKWRWYNPEKDEFFPYDEENIHDLFRKHPLDALDFLSPDAFNSAYYERYTKPLIAEVKNSVLDLCGKSTSVELEDFAQKLYEHCVKTFEKNRQILEARANKESDKIKSEKIVSDFNSRLDKLEGMGK